MRADLLSLRDLEPPTGDLSVRPDLSFTRAVWTAPIDGEADAPADRIIHIRCLQLHRAVRLTRLGLRRVPGYHKCGSSTDLDWVTAFRLWTWDGHSWRMARRETGVGRPATDVTTWFDLPEIESSAVIVEARRCGIDGWWTSWPLVSHAFVLEGSDPGPPAPRDERLLEIRDVSLENLGPNIRADRRDGTIHYHTPHFDLNFGLTRPGITSFRVGGSGNLMRGMPGGWYQGPALHPVGGPPLAAPSLRFAATGGVEVEGARIVYDFSLGESGLHYCLGWMVEPDALVLNAEVRLDTPIRVWDTCAWRFAFDIRTAPPHLLGRLDRRGRTGMVTTPAWLDLPSLSSIYISAEQGSPTVRFEAVRHRDMSILEIRLGETPQPLGDAVLEAGEHRATLRFRFDELATELSPDAPASVREAVHKRYLTALTYRADTATLSNNGASIHCPISMDGWSAVATMRQAALAPGVFATDFLRDSLERWLTGGPGYASGPLLREEQIRQAEDEYLMTGTAALLGLSDYLRVAGTKSWVSRYGEYIRLRISEMRHRDVDRDGLIESPHRTGTSGTGQWSTCWFDVISFGWKDAFANALLYAALRGLSASLPKLGLPDLSQELDRWSTTLASSYLDTFFNEKTGWLAGWRCKENRLHDYAFLPVNGAAVCAGLVPPDGAREIIERLWNEYLEVGSPDPILGLPGNLHPIPDSDLADIMQGYPMGYYQNGGRTHSQARHFVAALFEVGMREEGDHVLERLCLGLAEARVFGGCKSGIDWRTWDDLPCGYEGLLTDQFGVLGVALQRYAVTEPANVSTSD